MITWMSVAGSLLTILMVVLPEILKWLESNRTTRKAADVALTKLSVDNLRRIRERVFAGKQDGETPVP